MRPIKTKLSVLAVSVAVISGCSSLPEKTNESILEDSSTINSISKQGGTMTRSDVGVRVENSIFISSNPIRMSERDVLPEMFGNPAKINELTPVGMQDVLSMIAQNLNTRIEFSADALKFIDNIGGSSPNLAMTNEVLDQSLTATNSAGSGLAGNDITFSLRHTGTVETLLDYITSKVNLFWKWDQDHIEIFRLETKTITFDGDPTVAKFDSSSTTSKSTTAEGQANSSSTNSHSTGLSTEYGSVFAELNDAINSMISSEGRFNVSVSMGKVTITDTPAVVSKVEEYVEEMNKTINRQLLIKAQVYEVTSDVNGDFGADWSAGFPSFLPEVDLKLQSSTGGVIPNVSLGVAGSDTDSKTMISALNKNTNASLLTSASVYTKNGQTVPVQVVDERYFISEVNATRNEDASITYQPKSDVITSGFSMTVTPRVDSQGDISMRLAVDMSQLNGIEEKFYGQNGDGVTLGLPDRSGKNFVQNVSLESGKTLMLSGFERVEKSTGVSSVAGKGLWWLGGRKEGGNRKVMTVIMVTPYLMAK